MGLLGSGKAWTHWYRVRVQASAGLHLFPPNPNSRPVDTQAEVQNHSGSEVKRKLWSKTTWGRWDTGGTHPVTWQEDQDDARVPNINREWEG